MISFTDELSLGETAVWFKIPWLLFTLCENALSFTLKHCRELLFFFFTHETCYYDQDYDVFMTTFLP